MYWYKHTWCICCFGAALVWCLLLPSCKPDVNESGTGLKYFDLKGYFSANAANLTRLNKPVLKTVKHNGVSQTKKIHIGNWLNEFSLFIGSDINKPAWKDSYTVENTGTALIYKSKDTALQTTQIIINKTGYKVKWILIFNHTKNLLYETKEKLTYFPDSMYMIEKTQHVKMMGSNRYDVKGFFN